MINIVIVEDHVEYALMLRDVINSTNEFEVKAVYTSAEQAIAEIKSVPCAIAIIDIRLPGLSGVQLIRKLKSELYKTQYLVCSTHNDNDTVFQALKAGAAGYILKDSTPRQIKNALKELHNGGAPMSPYIARQIVNSYHEPVVEKENELSTREREVIELVSTGMAYNDVADKLFVSPETVKKHIRNIYAKLHVTNKITAINKFKGID